MRKLLYISFSIAVIALLVSSCKTSSKVVTIHDTIAIERTVVQEVERHDTTTIHDSTEIEREIIRYDTLGRITEKQSERIRTGKKEERGEQLKEAKRDTVYLTRTVTKTVTKETKPKQSPYPGIALAIIILGIIIYIGYKSMRQK